MATQIKFGTSGWRAVMAEEFTFANVHRALHGIARYVASQKSNGAKVIVGRDPRFLGESFCATAADMLSSYGITPLVIAEPAPTPAISYAVIQSKADGAINFTASHNPPEYNGIKFSTPDGAPSLPEVTQAIEREIAAFDANPQRPHTTKAEAQSQSIDPRRMYLSRLREIVDLDVIRKAGVKIAFDPMWGAARGYSDAFLREAGVTVATVHDSRDVLFGGHAPEPDDRLLEDLRHKMREIGAAIGIATDGDADRFGIIDDDGTFLQPNYIIALLFDYLVETRGWKTESGSPLPPPISSTRLPKNTKSRSTKLRLASNTLANLSSRTRSSSAVKKAPASPSANTSRRKTACSLACSAARWSVAVAPRLASNWATYLPKLVPSTRCVRTSA